MDDVKNEHVRKLTAARDRATKDRRELAKALSNPYKSGQTEQLREVFIVVQKMIEAVDRALEDEKRIAKTPSLVDPKP
jgi:hypothetical protein